MDKTEETAAKEGLIKLFFAPYEAVLVASCISWVLMDIETTVTEFENLHGQFYKGISIDELKEALNDQRKYCKLAWKDIIEYGAIHFRDMNDERGFDNWKKQLVEKERDNLLYHKLRDYVSIGSKLESQPEK